MKARRREIRSVGPRRGSGIRELRIGELGDGYGWVQGVGSGEGYVEGVCVA